MKNCMNWRINRKKITSINFIFMNNETKFLQLRKNKGKLLFKEGEI